MDGRLRLLGSEDTLAEGAAVLARPKLLRRASPDAVVTFRRALITVTEVLDPTETAADCRAPADNVILEAALAAARHHGAGAVVIVSDDRDLLVLNPWRGIRIVKPEAALAMTNAT